MTVESETISATQGVEPVNTLPDDIPSNAEILYDVSTEDGKYRFIYFAGARAPRGYRYGEFSQPMSNQMLGRGSMLSLVQELHDLRAGNAVVAELSATVPAEDSRETSDEIASLAGRILQAGNPLDNTQVLIALVNALPEVDRTTPEHLRDAMRAVLEPYFDNMLRLAGSCLSQAEPDDAA